MKSSLAFAWILIVLLSFQSCFEKQKKEDSKNTYFWNQTLGPSEKIEGEQAVLGRMICEALRAKREEISTWEDNRVQMDFQMIHKGCSDGLQERGVIVAKMRHLRGERLRLVATGPSEGLINDVLTERDRRLRDICAELVDGGSPENTFKDGNLSYQVSFFQARSKHYIQIIHFKRDAEGLDRPYLIDRGEVYTSDTTPDENRRGFLKVRMESRHCSGNSAQYWSQEWI